MGVLFVSPYAHLGGDDEPRRSPYHPGLGDHPHSLHFYLATAVSKFSPAMTVWHTLPRSLLAALELARDKPVHGN